MGWVKFCGGRGTNSFRIFFECQQDHVAEGMEWPHERGLAEVEFGRFQEISLTEERRTVWPFGFRARGLEIELEEFTIAVILAAGGQNFSINQGCAGGDLDSGGGQKP